LSGDGARKGTWEEGIVGRTRIFGSGGGASEFVDVAVSVEAVDLLSTSAPASFVRRSASAELVPFMKGFVSNVSCTASSSFRLRPVCPVASPRHPKHPCGAIRLVRLVPIDSEPLFRDVELMGFVCRIIRLQEYVGELLGIKANCPGRIVPVERLNIINPADLVVVIEVAELVSTNSCCPDLRKLELVLSNNRTLSIRY
jgi:hypothetical protein